MKATKLFMMAAMAVVASAGSAMAQASIFCGGATEAVLAANPSITCRLTNQVSATVPTVARLGITSVTTTLNAPLAADFATVGGVNSNGPTLNVRANAGYTLTASAAAPTWSGPAGSSKPATDLKMNVDGAGNVALGQVGTSSVATATQDYVIAYNTIYNWTTDIPGTYSLVVNYTLTAP